jgi:Large extracellular alpha-helical protein
VRCVTDANLKLLGVDSATLSAHRDAPTVFRFKAKVADVNLVSTKVRFEAVSKSNNKMTDAVEITLPVQPPTIVRKESVAGSFKGPQFDPHQVMPDAWKHGRGQFSTTISTSPWLPEIMGLPVILRYPHGCFEQISTKLLGYSLLANLLAYLPDLQERDVEYRATLERGMKQYADSLLSNGMLPYWPGGDTGNGFVTCQALWSVNESINAGFEAPAELQEKLSGAVNKILKGQIPASDLKSALHSLCLRSRRATMISGTNRRSFICTATKAAMKTGLCSPLDCISKTSWLASSSNSCAKSIRRSKSARLILRRLHQ